jgi:hypothetical protein
MDVKSGDFNGEEVFRPPPGRPYTIRRESQVRVQSGVTGVGMKILVNPKITIAPRQRGFESA